MAELVWSPRSLKDIELIYEFIKQDSIEAARAFVNELIIETINIPDFPYKGRLVPEHEHRIGYIFASIKKIYQTRI